MKRGGGILFLVVIVLALFSFSVQAVCTTTNVIQSGSSLLDLASHATVCELTNVNVTDSTLASVASKYSIFVDAAIHDSTVVASTMDNVDAYNSLIESSNVNCTKHLNVTGTISGNKLTEGAINASGTLYFAPISLADICSSEQPLAAILSLSPEDVKNNTVAFISLFAPGKTDLDVEVDMRDFALQPFNLSLGDNGTYPDEFAGDGLYTGLTTLQPTLAGKYTLSSRVQDGPFNVFTFNTTVDVDFTPPNLSIAINEGASTTGTRGVQIGATATDNSSIAGCRYSNYNLSLVTACTFTDLNCFPADVSLEGEIALTSGISSSALTSYAVRSTKQEYNISIGAVSHDFNFGTYSFWLRHPQLDASQQELLATLRSQPTNADFQLNISHNVLSQDYLGVTLTNETGYGLYTLADINYNALSDGNWHMISITWNITSNVLNLSIYVDGSLVQTNFTNWNDTTFNNDWTAALYPTKLSSHETLFDNVLIGGESLSSTRVSELFSQPNFYEWETCTAGKSFQLLDELGTQTVWGQALDSAGNVQTASDSIQYTASIPVDDDSAPTNVSIVDEGVYQAETNALDFEFTAFDSQSQVRFEMQLHNSFGVVQAWTSTDQSGISPFARFTSINISNNEQYTLLGRAYSETNASTYAISDGITIDLDRPVTRQYINIPNTDWSTTTNKTVILEMEDNISGLAGLSYSLAQGVGADARIDISSTNASNFTHQGLIHVDATPGQGFPKDNVALDGIGNVYYLQSQEDSGRNTTIHKFSTVDFSYKTNVTFDFDQGGGTRPEVPHSISVSTNGVMIAASQEVQGAPNDIMHFLGFNADGSHNSAWNESHTGVIAAEVLHSVDGGVYFVEGVSDGSQYLRLLQYTESGTHITNVSVVNGTDSLEFLDAELFGNDNVVILGKETANDACLLFYYTSSVHVWNKTFSPADCSGGFLFPTKDKHIGITGFADSGFADQFFEIEFDSAGKEIASISIPLFRATTFGAVGDLYVGTTDGARNIIVMNNQGTILENTSRSSFFSTTPDNTSLLRGGIVGPRGNIFGLSEEEDLLEVRHIPTGILFNPQLRANYSIALRNIADGKYAFSYRSTDKAGNWQGQQNATLQFDSSAPSTPAIIQGLESSILPLNVVWTSAKDITSGIETYHLRIDDNSDFSSPEFEAPVGNVTSYSYTPLLNATYYTSIRAENGAALNSSWSSTVGNILDQVPPSITIISPSTGDPGDTIASTRPTFRLTTDEVASCELINGVNTHPFTLTGSTYHEVTPDDLFIAPAHTNVQVLCTDTLGNQPDLGYQAQINFTINTGLTADGVAVSTAAQNYVDMPVNVTAAITSGITPVSGLTVSDFTVTIDNEDIGFGITDRGAGNYDLVLTPFTVGGIYSLQVRVGSGSDTDTINVAQPNLSIYYSGQTPSTATALDYIIYGTNSTQSIGLATESDEDSIAFQTSGDYGLHGQTGANSYLIVTQGSVRKNIKKRERYLRDGDFLDQTQPAFGLLDRRTDYVLALTLDYDNIVFATTQDLLQGRYRLVVKHEGYFLSGTNEGKANISVRVGS